jgi:hypothetical protein
LRLEKEVFKEGRSPRNNNFVLSQEEIRRRPLSTLNTFVVLKFLI